jgi:hypothetical protein
MIEVMHGFPEEVLAVRGSGRIRAEDYRETLIPETERRIRENGSLRLLYWLGRDVDGITAGAMWEDAKVGLTHWSEFGRIAVVTDHEWIVGAVRLFRPFFRHPVRVFSNDAIEEAKRWIVEADPPS